MEEAVETFTYHVYAAMETMVDLIVPNYRVAPSSNLNPSQGVAVNIIVLQNPSPPSKKVHAPLETPEDFVVTQGWVAFTSDPDTSVSVGKYFVLNELAPSL